VPAMDEVSGSGPDEGRAAEPAATVVVARDGDDGLEVLLLRRNARPPFAGMWVFPGGRVEPGDADPQRPGDDLAAARRAAVRETEEEAGIVLDIDGLVPYAHWTPPGTTPRRFTTWFFLAPAPATLVVVDGTEIHEGAWLAPAEALRRRDSTEIELAPPTWVTLWQLSAVPDVAAAVAAAAARQPERFATRVAQVDGATVALWRGDAGYTDGDGTRPGPRHRLWMVDGGWRYERSGPG
jgi:8-oxo-dGTP pyrophosphatase MutT (NUDIX family)